VTTNRWVYSHLLFFSDGHLGIDLRQLNVGIIKSTAKRPQKCSLSTFFYFFSCSSLANWRQVQTKWAGKLPQNDFPQFSASRVEKSTEKRKKEKRTWVEVFYLPGCTRHYFAAHFSNTRLDSSPMAITITFHQNVTCLAFICRTGATPHSAPKGDCFSRANRIELPLFPPKKQDCLLIWYQLVGESTLAPKNVFVSLKLVFRFTWSR